MKKFFKIYKEGSDFFVILKNYLYLIMFPILVVGMIVFLFMSTYVADGFKEMSRYKHRQSCNLIDSITETFLIVSSDIIAEESVENFITQKGENRMDTNYLAWKARDGILKYTESYNIENVAVYSVCNEVFVNKHTAYSKEEYFARMIDNISMDIDEFSKYIEKRSGVYYVLPYNENSEYVIFCRNISENNTVKGVLLYTLSKKDITKKTESAKNGTNDEAVNFVFFDKYGGKVLEIGNTSPQIAQKAFEEGRFGEYQRGGKVILVSAGKNSRNIYVSYMNTNIFYGNVHMVLFWFVICVLVVIVAVLWVSGKQNKKIKIYFDKLSSEVEKKTNEHRQLLGKIQEEGLVKFLSGERGELGEGITFPCGKMTVLVVYCEASEEESEPRRFFEMTDIKFYSARKDENILCYILNYDDEYNREEIGKIFNIRASENEHGLFAGLGSEVENIHGLKRSYSEAMLAMKHCQASGVNGLIKCEEIQLENTSDVKRFNLSGKMLVNAIKKGKKDEVEEVFETVIFKDYKDINVDLIRSLILCLGYHLYILMGDIYENDTYKFGQFERMIGNLMAMEGAEALEIIKMVSMSMLENVKKPDEQVELKQTILEYIENHYTESGFSLQMLSDHMDMNYSYVSRIFSEFFGVSFAKYITDRRLKKGAELLDESEMRVKDIAEKIGFYSSTVFINLFKKNYGVTPGEYRQRDKI